MNTNFQMIKKLDNFTPSRRGVLTNTEVMLIENTLCLGEMDVLQLRNLRDFVVLYYSTKVDDDTDVREQIRIADIVSGITAVIDNAIFMAGGNV